MRMEVEGEVVIVSWKVGLVVVRYVVVSWYLGLCCLLVNVGKLGRLLVGYSSLEEIYSIAFCCIKHLSS